MHTACTKERVILLNFNVDARCYSLSPKRGQYSAVALQKGHCSAALQGGREGGGGGGGGSVQQQPIRKFLSPVDVASKSHLLIPVIKLAHLVQIS